MTRRECEHYLERLLFVLAGFAAGILVSHPTVTLGNKISVDTVTRATPQASPATVSPVAPADSRPLYTVAKVMDGDTIAVMKDGVYTKVRLIGINTPEIYDGTKTPQCFGTEAAQKAHEILDGTQVSLEPDSSQGTTDKYGRTLAYVFLPDGTSFEKQMIAEGYGREYTYRTAYKYQKEFRAAEAAAKAAHAGLWSACQK